MKPDLEALYIGKGELKILTEAETTHWGAVFYLLSLVAALFVAGLAWVPAISALIATFQISISVYLIILVIASLGGAWIFSLILQENSSFNVLLEQVDKFNAVIKSVDIRDQLEEVGHTGVRIPDDQRKKLIDALSLTRADLVQALRTEKILRENRNFIADNPELFANNFISLQELQIRDQANMSGPLFDDVLKISRNIQDEIQKLRKQIRRNR